jgi:hypothetical protein
VEWLFHPNEPYGFPLRSSPCRKEAKAAYTKLDGFDMAPPISAYTPSGGGILHDFSGKRDINFDRKALYSLDLLQYQQSQLTTYRKSDPAQWRVCRDI